MVSCKFNIGDVVKVVRPEKGFKANHLGKIYTIRQINPNGIGCYTETHYGVVEMSECAYVWLESELELVTNEKIVITHNGKVTTATLYRNDGSKKTATARCAPEDTFDFNVGAKLAITRLVGEETKYNIGDRIFAEDNMGMYRGGAWGTVVEVLDKRIHNEDYVVKFDKGYRLCSHVVPVPTTPEPPKPKYYNGKVVCISNKINDHDFTVGKVYEIKDGKFTDNNHAVRPSTVHKVTCLDDLKKGYFADWYYEFIPIVN